LPAQDAQLTSSLLTALRKVPSGTPLRLLPGVFDRRLAAAVAAELPGAELLSPCSDDEHFAARASHADLVVVADLSDPFDRHALTAAAVGTQPVTLNADGPAQDVLGPGVVSAASALATQICALLAEPTERDSLQNSVRASCSPSQIEFCLGRPDRPVP
jgi:hypothetical protein